MLTLESLQMSQGAFLLSADFTIGDGQRVAIVGPSGAGKSTLLNVIAGFIAPTTGRVMFNELDFTAAGPAQRPMSMLFQDNNLFPHLTVHQNVALGLSPGLKLTADQESKVQEALVRVGIGDLGDRKPAALSGGQQSRVALARVLLRGQPLLLLDEPFAALGPALKDEMLALVTELSEAQGTTILMVTHDPKDARKFSDQTIFISGGLAHAPQDTDQLFENPPKALREYLG